MKRLRTLKKLERRRFGYKVVAPVNATGNYQQSAMHGRLGYDWTVFYLPGVWRGARAHSLCFFFSNLDAAYKWEAACNSQSHLNIWRCEVRDVRVAPPMLASFGYGAPDHFWAQTPSRYGGWTTPSDTLCAKQIKLLHKVS